MSVTERVRVAGCEQSFPTNKNVECLCKIVMLFVLKGAVYSRF